MEYEPKLDDRYTEGIWYDQTSGDYCEIQESDDGERVELVNPENNNVYWDTLVSEWVDGEQEDFRQVSEQAVEDPQEVVRRAVRRMMRNDINDLATTPVQEEIDLIYAWGQVEIVEK